MVFDPRLVRSFALGCLLVPALCFAWPVDVFVDLEVGGDEFKKLSAISWAQSEDLGIVTVEVMPSGEILLTGKGPGRALILLYAEGKFAVWRARVSPKGERVKAVEGAAELIAARGACPGLRVEDGTLFATIKDERCRAALLALFQTDAFKGAELDLTFELAALQAQIAAIEKALRGTGARDLAVSSRGAGLVMTGAASVAQHRLVLWALFKNSAGRVPLDDRIEVDEGVHPHPDPLPVQGEGRKP